MSVLTESRFFGGTLQDLQEASAACGDLPVLRKDFVLDEYMLAESRARGADLVLLMVSVLGGRTGEMVRLARRHSLEPLVEVHGEAEMDVAAESGARLVGINNRDLSTLSVDLATSERLLPRVPPGAIAVVESGIKKREDMEPYIAVGYRAFLIGEAIASATNVAAKLKELAG